MEILNITKAALRLIREGSFLSVSMAEIGYHAKVSGSTVNLLFRSREQLAVFLGQVVFTDIKRVIESTRHRQSDIRQRYFDIWDDLAEYYHTHPDVVAFLNSYPHFPFDVQSIREAETKVINQLTEELSMLSSGSTIANGIFAQIVHENIKTAAQLGPEQSRELAMLFLAGLDNRNGDILSKMSA